MQNRESKSTVISTHKSNSRQADSPEDSLTCTITKHLILNPVAAKLPPNNIIRYYEREGLNAWIQGYSEKKKLSGVQAAAFLDSITPKNAAEKEKIMRDKIDAALIKHPEWKNLQYIPMAQIEKMGMACYSNNIAELRALAQEDPRLLVREHLVTKLTPLHHATAHAPTLIVLHELLNQYQLGPMFGELFSSKDKDDQIPLNYALDNGDWSSVFLLMQWLGGDVLNPLSSTAEPFLNAMLLMYILQGDLARAEQIIRQGGHIDTLVCEHPKLLPLVASHAKPEFAAALIQSDQYQADNPEHQKLLINTLLNHATIKFVLIELMIKGLIEFDSSHSKLFLDPVFDGVKKINTSKKQEPKESETKDLVKSEMKLSYFNFFPPREGTSGNRFLSCVAGGKQDQAEFMLQSNPDFALESHTVTDLSGRKFERITGFQYAVWALDWRMWVMILKYLPKELAALQYISFIEQNKDSAHFDLSSLIDKLSFYIKNFRQWEESICQTAWSEEVGRKQRLLPVHIVNEYCQPGSEHTFNPKRVFGQETLHRTRTVYKIESSNAANDWYSAGTFGLLGKNFGVFRAGKDVAIATSKPKDFIVYDRDALQRLSTFNQAQLKKLKTALGVEPSDQQAGAEKKQEGQLTSRRQTIT